MRLLFLLISLFVAGCQTKPVITRPAPLPVAEFPTKPDARIAVVVGHYTLGAYVDPDSDLIRHEAHAIQRIETEARWDLRAVSGEPPPPSLAAATVVPWPVATSQALEVRSDTASVVSPVPVPPPSVAIVDTASPSPDARSPEHELVQVITLNADGFIDLTVLPSAGDAEVNPFAVRSTRTDATREISLLVAGVVQGGNPCALINGRPVQPGDTLESLTLVRLEADAALFRHDGKLVRLPVTTKPARLRVAL